MPSNTPPLITVPAQGASVADVAVVYTTWPDLASAELAATELLTARLATCLNILPGMISHYRWNGNNERAAEVVMLIKTSAKLADACVEAVCRIHPYAIPAALVIPVTSGAQPFLDWINAGTTSAGSDAAN
jgi:periplasmic divalent cation tolerance protein